MALKEYKAKRNFSSTAEPAGKVASASRAKKQLFVVQKHDASRLHYDFRLEMEGVLKSWAVPKGFPVTRGDRRLAVEVEDHPLDYADFEGTIPEGNYGAGTVMVWDTGWYEVLGGEPLSALKAGKLHLRLHGKKLDDEWTLVRMRARENEDKPQWLLLKSGEDITAFSARSDDQSVLTRRSMNQIASQNKRQWQSNRPSNDKAPPNRSKSRSRSQTTRAQPLEARVVTAPALRVPRLKVNLDRWPKSAPRFVEPMKALLIEKLPKGEQWLYELKFDGVRSVATKDKKIVSLFSRAANSQNEKFPEILEALKALPARQFVLDGEIVAIDEEGRSSFQLLQSYHIPGAEKPPLLYYVFDVLNLDGKDLTGLPLLQRKAIAEALTANAPEVIRFSPAIDADSGRLLKELQARGLEGLIAKRKDSKYEIGRRSGSWLKYKWTNEQEFVIGGYTPPQGGRTHFGALLVGYYQSGKLLFAGKVGTGFDQKLLGSLFSRFQQLRRKECPFSNLPEKTPRARGRGLTASQMRSCTWLEPRLVCQVRFAEWTRDNHLRQPAFLGLRDDKKAKEVAREKPARR